MFFFMLISILLIPFTMILFGAIFLKRPPKEINGLYGYRTARSSQNRETWNFAHKYCGKLWRSCGLIMVPASVVAFIPFAKGNESAVGMAGMIICMIQVTVMTGTIYFVEKALKNTFDERGRRK